MNPELLKENLPKPYLWLVAKKYFLFNGVIKSTFFVSVATLIDYLIFGECHSIVVLLAVLYWLGNFMKNFLFVMGLKMAYNENKEECMKILRELFPDA